MRIFRWKAIVPLVIVVALVALVWTLCVDRLVRLVVEFVGTEVVGAKVELASARVRLFEADVVLRGLQVTNPNAPMTNLVQADEIVADLDGLALLEKKAVVETLAVRGVRFGTQRATSGAVRSQSPMTGAVTRRVLGWANSIPIPTLDLAGLGGVAEFAGVSADSLQSLRLARGLVASGDSMRAAWERELRALDPAPTVDSATALAERLRTADPRRLGVVGVRDVVANARSVLGRVGTTRERLAGVQQEVGGGVAAMRRGAAEMDRARQADYAYAQRLVRVPSLATPDVSMALFGEMAVARMKPLLYWLGVVEQYVPAGLRPQERPGPERVRMAGTTFTFPKERTYPAFVLVHGDASLFLGGSSAATGAYRAWVSGVTTEPAVYGRPLRFAAQRTAAAVGPHELRVAGMMDRVGGVPRDSVDALVGGVGFPAATIAAAGARLDFGEGTVRLSLQREGTQLAGVLHLSAPAATWTRTSDTAAAAAAAPRLGSREWAEGLVWRAVSSVRDVEVEIRFSGRQDSPLLAVSSNVGDAVAGALRGELGAEIARLQSRARAEVDRVVGQPVAQARARLGSLESDVQGRLAAQQRQLQDAQAEIERRIQDLTQVVPGVRLPSLPRIRP